MKKVQLSFAEICTQIIIDNGIHLMTIRAKPNIH